MCIDLKSFYASVECVERKLDPLTTNLVVADSSRTEKTICLAVSPSLKKYGIPGRARLFEVVQKVREINRERRKHTTTGKFVGKSYDEKELEENKDLELDYIVARPRMRYYMKYSNDIYKVYLKYLSKDDIYVYSIDEVFCDITDYMNYYKLSKEDLVTKIIKDVYDTTGITATAGIGTNLYLAKIAMDIVAKHAEPNSFGVRLASLDEMSYRRLLWNHRPLTSFWRTGPGLSKRLEKMGIYTMGDLARASLINEDKLYKVFGVNAELMIDHAWGYEPVEIKDIKAFRPSVNSISLGQVLQHPYNYDKTKIIVKEMADSLVLDLVAKHLVTNQIVLTITYDVSNLENDDSYDGEVVLDRYSRKIPKHAHGTINIDHKTSSAKIIIAKAVELYDRIIDPNLLVRKLNIVACNVVDESSVKEEPHIKQIDLFTDFKDYKETQDKENKDEIEERKLASTLLNIKKKYGKNAILKGMNFEEGATMRERNGQVGGHKG
jgi:DNA polymerase V